MAVRCRTIGSKVSIDYGYTRRSHVLWIVALLTLIQPSVRRPFQLLHSPWIGRSTRTEMRFDSALVFVVFDLIWFDLILFSGADWLVRFRVDSARFTAPLPSDWLALFCNGLIIGAGGRGVCWMNWGKRPISSRQSSRHLMKLDETWWNLIWYQKWMKRIMAM